MTEFNSFDLIDKPIYVIDSNWNLVFINEAAANYFSVHKNYKNPKCYQHLACNEEYCKNGCPIHKIIHSPSTNQVYFRTIFLEGGITEKAEFSLSYYKEGKTIKYYIITLNPVKEYQYINNIAFQNRDYLKEEAKKADIREIFDVSELEKLVSLFAEIHGVTSAIFDNKNELVTNAFNFFDSCMLVRSSEKGLQKCLESDAKLVESAEKKPVVLKCLSAGLMDAASPIIVENQKFGTWALGQVIIEGDYDEGKLRKFASDIGIDEDKFIALLEENSVISKEKMQKMADFLFHLSNILGRAGLMNIASEKLNADLWEEKERLNVTLQSIGDGVIVVDTVGFVENINLKAESILETKNAAAKNKSLGEIFTIKENFQKISKVSNEPLEYLDNLQDKLLLKNGNAKDIEFNVSPITSSKGNILGSIIVFRDITDQLILQQETLKLEKLQGLAVFAGGIAHDFNNMLTGILTNLSIIKNICKDNPDLQNRLKQVEKIAKESTELTKQLMTFSKGGHPFKELSDLKNIVKETAGFVTRGSKVKLSYNFNKNIPKIPVDKGQMSQLIQNLTINALQAISNGGSIEIDIDKVNIGESSRKLEEGEYIKVSITDTGKGIPAHIINKIFDPFYTTKPEGNGLGLSSCYAIVEKHSGDIIVESSEGEGTRFDIYLPVNSKVNKNKVKSKNFEKFEIAGKTFIYMDDEETIRDSVKVLIKEYGGNVITAKDGDEVIEIISKLNNHGSSLDAVILDFTIPGGKGALEIIDDILSINKEIPVYLTSGYTDDERVLEPEKLGFSGFIQKPFTLESLISSLC